MKKIFVTGGAGFIGSEFVRKGVKRGEKVSVIDKLTYAGDLKRIESVKSDISFYKCDITDRNSIEKILIKEKPDVIVHFAAESHVDRSIFEPFSFVETNIKGTAILLDAVKKLEIEKFINISTDEVYGELKREGKFRETSPLNPNSPYAVSKASADMMGRAYFRTYGIPIITVRASNNYGPWQYPEKLIPVIILKAYKNEKIPIYGKGENVREWLFVEDFVEAIFKIIYNGKIGEIYNVGSGFEKKNIDVAKTILSLMGKPYELIEFVEDRPGHDFRYSLSSEKIKKELGWKPLISFEQGVKKTVEWYLSEIEWVIEKSKELQNLWKKVYKKTKIK